MIDCLLLGIYGVTKNGGRVHRWAHDRYWHRYSNRQRRFIRTSGRP